LVARPIEAVWFWRYSTAPFRAVYGRLPGPYSKDYLQTSGECSKAFDRVFGRQRDEVRSIAYVWPGGRIDGIVKQGGGYDPPGNLRLNFRWPTNPGAPQPWRLFQRAGSFSAFPGDPSHASVAGADAELERFQAGDYDPWLLAVKLADDADSLHVRAYMGRPPHDRGYASIENLPAPLLAPIRAHGAEGCGVWTPGPSDGESRPSFDPDRVFDAWPEPAALVPRADPLSLVLVADPGAGEGDVTGISYVYSNIYADRVVTGRSFVYFRGGDEGADPCYFGTGLVGAIRESALATDQLVCDIDDYHAFEEPVIDRGPDGAPFEAERTRPEHREEAVRIVPVVVLEAIVEAADLTDEPAAVVAGPNAGRQKPYAASDLAQRIDAYAMDVAAVEVGRRYPRGQVTLMPHNNPGYDIRVSAAGGVVRYVEVKGTASERGAFFISEGERLFAEVNADRFSLCVVRAIDLEQQMHLISWHDGRVGTDAFSLRVRQWQGIIPTVR
jgi:hypothetical protein